MPAVRVRASSFTAADFASVANAVDAGTGTFATWTNNSRRGSTTGTFGGFDFSAIPPLATITAVTAFMRHYENATGNMNTVEVAAVSVPLASAATEHSVSLGTSLPSTIDVAWTRGNNTTSTVCYVDYLDVEVSYDEYLGSGFQGWDGSQWRSGKLKRWTGSKWEGAQVKRWTGATWEVVP
jgi:hypothetical protein